MIVKNLDKIDFDDLLHCFLQAFESYYVKMPTNKAYYIQRWKQANVDFRFSYGMFDQNKLVGFIIHAIDHRNGKLTAFNTGTGVLPEYRGRKIVKSIYKEALQDLKQNGITKCSLEVIKENLIAIRLYKSIGFDICKHYKCFSGVITVNKEHQVDIKEIGVKEADVDSLPNQEYYSWDNQLKTIQKGRYRFFKVFKNDNLESFFIIDSEVGYLAQFDVLMPDNKSWERLFFAIQKMANVIKINNVDERLADKINFLNSIGLKNTVDQYEMEMKVY
ncbi:GNAT family N-acetyltransferase [Aquimarina sp. 2201CG5-10]|uniref:GNAT family N-acetyltransferase n=1 Tax=Aquimarina callyspongiae TaxID=3098150 RepID=UPI002AB55F3F|nr:GNAT family N-acetyltransferase [Aquimarina sp. 2201CG5-10]MDY8138071.1 GNAT family N-acetyltransferase [Aquimarina sp. 2201CG5-10]